MNNFCSINGVNFKYTSNIEEKNALSRKKTNFEKCTHHFTLFLIDNTFFLFLEKSSLLNCLSYVPVCYSKALTTYKLIIA